MLLVLLAWVGTALAGWLALGWALTLASVVPGAAGRWSGRLADRLTPTLVRRAFTVLLGATSVSVILPTATAVRTVAAPQSPGDPTGQPTPGFVPTSGLAAHDAAAPDPGLRSTAKPAAGSPTPPASAPRRVTQPVEVPSAGHASPTSHAPAPGFRPTRPSPVLDAAASGLLARPPRPAVAALDTVTVRRGDSLWSIARQHLGGTASDAEVARAWPSWYVANRAIIGDDPDLIQPGTQLVPPGAGDAR